ncbi:MAG TPA: hypothetical protein VFQ44_01835 [Streptosporangiaceae bacterium]|nr:hypothetical protein [Streptosporangiaceae bacterium]
MRAAFFGGPLADQVKNITAGHAVWRVPVPLPPLPGWPQFTSSDDIPPAGFAEFSYMLVGRLPSGDLAYWPANPRQAAQ